MEYPKQFKYTKDHEWIDMAGSQARVGVTAYAIEQLGDIVHIDLPKVGTALKQGAAFGTIESTKTVSDLFSPVSGKIVAVNDKAVASPESLQTDPYEGGWLVKIELAAASEGSSLLSAGDYVTYIKEHGG